MIPIDTLTTPIAAPMATPNSSAARSCCPAIRPLANAAIAKPTVRFTAPIKCFRSWCRASSPMSGVNPMRYCTIWPAVVIAPKAAPNARPKINPLPMA